MQTLDDTWAQEAHDLGLRVARGRPAWCDPPVWDMPLPTPENAKELRTLIASLWGDE